MERLWPPIGHMLDREETANERAMCRFSVLKPHIHIEGGVSLTSVARAAAPSAELLSYAVVLGGYAVYIGYLLHKPRSWVTYIAALITKILVTRAARRRGPFSAFLSKIPPTVTVSPRLSRWLPMSSKGS